MSHKPPRTEKCIDRTDRLTNYCEHCGEAFLPEESRSVQIRGPGTIIWSCPQCKRTSRGIAPEEDARPPVITDLVVTVDENGHTTAAIVFPNEARLQYRETDDGYVRKEVISSSEKLESVSIGLQEEVKTFAAYARSIKRYGELTEPEVRREMPLVARSTTTGGSHTPEAGRDGYRSFANADRDPQS